MTSSTPNANDTSSTPAGDSVGGGAPAFSPLYQQIKSLILQSLQAGAWKPGEMIPSEMELAARYRVSQGTVRKAIDELAAENLLLRRQGKGTFVATHAERNVQYRFLRLLPDAGDRNEEGPTQRNIISCRTIKGLSDICKLLQVPTGESLIHVRRVLVLASTPTILEDLWLPSSNFKGLSAEQMRDYPGATYAMFEVEYGVRMVRAEEKLRAVLPDEAQAQLLQVDQATPLLSVERVAYTYNDVPMELRRGLYRTDTHHYSNTLS
ncbi:GntR family transcriptional regulator [Comamonas odontotermitis]|uniref:GntR family transcriptional regulator n=1 Tax=Comamonas TaxID=283 RepID=UPI001CC7A1F5|nr:GntR family transcriptional regulator [Comamonas odontotermitis]UBB18263.1 GntR family transcriptional regulator [Comamonas odontotermitis]